MTQNEQKVARLKRLIADIHDILPNDMDAEGLADFLFALRQCYPMSAPEVDLVVLRFTYLEEMMKKTGASGVHGHA